MVAQQIDAPVTKADLETIRRLQESYATELAALKTKVDKVETKVATVENSNFQLQPVNSKLTAFVGTNAEVTDAFPQISPLFDDAQGSLSRFGTTAAVRDKLKNKVPVSGKQL